MKSKLPAALSPKKMKIKSDRGSPTKDLGKQSPEKVDGLDLEWMVSDLIVNMKSKGLNSIHNFNFIPKYSPVIQYSKTKLSIQLRILIDGNYLF